MNTATHTPTPWTLRGRLVEVSGRGEIARCILPADGGVFEATENAAFIVRACNTHDELVAALTKAREIIRGRDLEYAVVDVKDMGMGLGKFIDAALAKAGAA